MDDHETAAIVHRAIDALDEPFRSITRRRLSGETLDAIGLMYGKTRERIRQLEMQAKAKLRRWIDDNHPNLTV